LESKRVVKYPIATTEDEALIAQFKSGKTLRAIAIASNGKYLESAISDRLKQYGIDPNQNHYSNSRARQIIEANTDFIRERLAAGDSAETVGRAIGVSGMTLRKYLRQRLDIYPPLQ
jgi:response regulator of citrate/malate metabolism